MEDGKIVLSILLSVAADCLSQTENLSRPALKLVNLGFADVITDGGKP